MAVEHHVRAKLDHAVFQTRLQHDRGIVAARVAPDHSTGIAYETAQLDRGARVGVAELAPGHSALPRGGRAFDRRLIEMGRALEPLQLAGSFHGARVHERVVAISELNALEVEPHSER